MSELSGGYETDGVDLNDAMTTNELSRLQAEIRYGYGDRRLSVDAAGEVEIKDQPIGETPLDDLSREIQGDDPL